MTSGVGKRAAHKAATRDAIQAAADALFAARGYADTTVRDIAGAAGVTERTFFRYFPGKEALLVRDIEAWLPDLGRAIELRPATESALTAVQNALFAVADQIRAASPTLSWLFHDGPPGPRLHRSAPELLLKFEQVIAEALHRRRQVQPCSADAVFADQVLARCAVAALRSTGIRLWQLRMSSDGSAPDQVDEVALTRRAFALIGEFGP